MNIWPFPRLSKRTVADVEVLKSDNQMIDATESDSPKRWPFSSSVRVWTIGYAFQLGLYCLFLASMRTRFEISKLEWADVLYAVFNTLLAISFCISLYSICYLTKAISFPKKILLFIGTTMIFGATWLGFWLFSVKIAFSRI